MIKNINRKKFFIFAGIVLLLLVVGGVFWWWKEKTKGTAGDYIIRETKEGKIVENKKAGLTVKVPDDWEVKKIETNSGAINFHSPRSEVQWKEGKIILPPKKGCVIQTEVLYKNMDLTQIKKEAEYTHLMLGKKADEFKEITINNSLALKNTFDTVDAGPGIGIYIPNKKKVYVFYLVWSRDERENCIREFESFIKTISIK